MTVIEKINKSIEILQMKPSLTDKEQQILNNLLQQKEIIENNTEISKLIGQAEEGKLLINDLKESIQTTGDTLDGLSSLIELGQALSDLVGIAYYGVSSVVSGIGGLLGGIVDILSTLSDIFGGFSG